MVCIIVNQSFVRKRIAECDHFAELFHFLHGARRRKRLLAEIKKDRKRFVFLPLFIRALELFFRARLRGRGRRAHPLPHHSNEDVVIADLFVYDLLGISAQTRCRVRFPSDKFQENPLLRSDSGDRQV
jgi:hypothetical protein